MSAWKELQEFIGDEDKLEAIIFGPWGWGSAPREGKQWESGYSEPLPPPVPFELRGKVLSAKEAKPLMQSWDFLGGHGAPECYAIRAFSKKKVIWVTQYDGATGLDWAPRNPEEMMPDMPGG